MTPPQAWVTTLETAWSVMLPDYEIPNIKILLSWRRYYTIETVIEAIEEAAKIATRKGNLDSDAVGRICSSTARKLQAQKFDPPFPNANS